MTPAGPTGTIFGGPEDRTVSITGERSTMTAQAGGCEMPRPEAAAPEGDDPPLSALRVAIVHYWLVGMRGGEKVLEELCEIFPQADLYTHVAIPRNLSEKLRRHRIRETFIAKLPGGRRHYQKYLPLMPRALEALDLDAYDLVISSESGPAKGVITGPDTLHLCYCHSPMRYVWDQYPVYRAQAGRLTRWLMPLAVPRLRMWDQSSAARVDRIVANSDFVRRRIAKSWGRAASVVHPPVDLDAFVPQAGTPPGDFYLYVGELVSYKRVDLLIDAFNASGRKLVVIGDGGERDRLEARANGNIRFHGRASLDELKAHYARCRALMFPGVEDFGIVPLEAMASGRPVIAYARGGALETVKDGVTGLFFDRPDVDSINAAIARFESELEPAIDPAALRAHVDGFSRARFRAGMLREIEAVLATRKPAAP
jgi:glycosyltransferase involved in cell wall biosynthesis